jgi:hypothetical protein
MSAKSVNRFFSFQSHRHHNKRRKSTSHHLSSSTDFIKYKSAILKAISSKANSTNSNIMTCLSNPDLSEAPQFGRYVDFVESKKSEHTPVRRSCRNRRGTPFVKKMPSLSHDEGKEEDPCDRTEDTTKGNNVDDLCVYFATTLKVNDALKVTKVNTKKLSPNPKLGRYITAAEDDSITVTPIKRSLRNIHKKK